ncbi:unnamed protein product, partial [Iphiclides podalirius]
MRRFQPVRTVRAYNSSGVQRWKKAVAFSIMQQERSSVENMSNGSVVRRGSTVPAPLSAATSRNKKSRRRCYVGCVAKLIDSFLINYS